MRTPPERCQLVEERSPDTGGGPRGTGYEPVAAVDFVQTHYADADEYRRVTGVADELRDLLMIPEIAAQMLNANHPGRWSPDVQGVFLDQALGLGFRDESKGLFAGYPSSGLRPRLGCPLSDRGMVDPPSGARRGR